MLEIDVVEVRGRCPVYKVGDKIVVADPEIVLEKSARYAVEHRIVTNVALAPMAFILIGFFLISTATTLYAITMISKKMNGA